MISSSSPTSIATGFVGGYTGRLIQGLLRIEDIQTDFVDIAKETRTNVILHLEDEGEIRLNSSGPEITGLDYQYLLDKLKEYSDVDAAAVCGSVCRGMENSGAYNQILAQFKTSGRRCTTYLDTGQPHIEGALQSVYPPDYVKPNIEEFCRLSQITGAVLEQGDSSQEDALQKKYCSDDFKILEKSWPHLLDCYDQLANRFRNTNFLLSLSKLGALVKDRETENYLHCYYCGDVSPKTFVGAGDSFLGGFMLSLSETPDTKKALRVGVAASLARLSGEHLNYGYIDTGLLTSFINDKQLRVIDFKKSEVRAHQKSCERFRLSKIEICVPIDNESGCCIRKL